RLLQLSVVLLARDVVVVAQQVSSWHRYTGSHENLKLHESRRPSVAVVERVNPDEVQISHCSLDERVWERESFRRRIECAAFEPFAQALEEVLAVLSWRTSIAIA